MNIVFISVRLNIHQVGVSDELYRLTNGQYWFIETGNQQHGNSKGGDDFSSRPYLIRPNEGSENEEKAKTLVREADVMIYGAAPLFYLKERVKTGKLTFLYSERWLKRGLINILSPRLLAQQWFYHTQCHNKPVYALCASAYAAGDFAKMLSFRGKCYKWGYFTACPEFDIEDVQVAKRSATVTKILWCGRLIGWKHPEAMVALAERLRAEQRDFVIDMIGSGELHDRLLADIRQRGLEEYVHLLGALPNDDVTKAMREHHIACFTSDRNEGWGAVLNEAMAQGCCPVSSIETGSTPYLVKDGVNGFSFNLNKKDELSDKVMWLIDHPKEREQMSIEAYKTIHDVWSPQNAAKNLHSLCDAMLQGKTIDIPEGPCSKAE